MTDQRISTEEAERIAESLDFDCKCHKCASSAQQLGATAIRALAAERDELDRALRKATWGLANFTFRGKDTSLGEEAERQHRAALGEEEK